MVGGILDDKFSLSPAKQIWFPLVATLVVLGFGIGLLSITSPFGGALYLDMFSFSVFGLGNILLLADVLVFFWLMSMMFTTKLLDGMDGLSTGIVTIGAIVVFFLSQQPQWFQPEVSLFAAIFIAGAGAGVAEAGAGVAGAGAGEAACSAC